MKNGHVLRVLFRNVTYITYLSFFFVSSSVSPLDERDGYRQILTVLTECCLQCAPVGNIVFTLHPSVVIASYYHLQLLSSRPLPS